MANKDKINEIELSNKTISELDKYNIPPSPKCYEVMYEYLKGQNIEIINSIEKFLKKHDNLTEIFLLKVHSSVLSYETIAKTVNTVTSLLDVQITGLNDSVSSSDQELNVFTDAIDSFSEYIDNDAHNMTDRNIISYIVSATTRVKDKVKELETDLHNSQAEIKQLHNYLENMCQEAMVDPLTTLATRKRCDQILSKSIRNCLETSENMSVVFIEIDHYDAFKEKWGQVTSEQILRFTASALKENIKGRDAAARYSESLFIMILPKTDAHGAKILSEHIRNTVERKRIIKKTTGEFLGRVTVSAGIAQFKEGESLGYLLNRAERTLAIARQNGRNCSMTEEEAADFMQSNNSGDMAANG